MAVPWIKVATNLPQHPKIYALAEELGLNDKLLLPETMAAGIIINLWTWALTNQPNGDLSGVSDRAIARVCGWQGKPDKLIGALISCGFLDGDRYIHDWEDYTLAFNDQEEHRREKTRERVARYREQKRNADVTQGVTLCNADVTVTGALHCNADVTPCNADVTPLDKNKIREDKIRIREDKNNSILEKEKINKKEKETDAAAENVNTDPRYKVFRDDDVVLKRLKGEDAEFEAALERIRQA